MVKLDAFGFLIRAIAINSQLIPFVLSKRLMISSSLDDDDDDDHGG